MDFFLANCQALGIALAVGALAGAVWPRDANPSALLLTAAVLGAVGAALSISADGESVIGGIVAGAIGGPLAAAVVASLVAGAARGAATRPRGAGGIPLVAA